MSDVGKRGLLFGKEVTKLAFTELTGKPNEYIVCPFVVWLMSIKR